MVKIFFGLPSSLSAAIICDWLNLKSACRLDTATCAQKERSTLLDLLQSVECVGQLEASNNEQLQWMNKKRISSRLLFLSNRLEEGDCEEYLQRSGRYLRLLLASLVGGTLLAMVVQHCRHLVTIRLKSRDQQGDLTELLSVNPNLVEITLSSSVPLSMVDIKLPNLKYLLLRDSAFGDDTLPMLVKSTSQLCYLSLSMGRTSITSAGLIEATRHCPLLRFFEPPDLPDIDYALQQVTQSCVYIEHILFFNCTRLTNRGIAAVAQNVRSLRSIHITYSPNITNTCLLSLAEYQYRTLEIVIVEEPLAVNDETEVMEERETFNVEAVTAFRAACTNLKDFAWQRTIDAYGDNAGEIVATHLASADRVTTLSVFHLDDAILFAIATHCAQLRALNLDYVEGEDIEQCSDAMLLHMVENCTCLNTIVVSDPTQRVRLQGLFAANTRVNIIERSGELFAHSFEALYVRQNPLRL